MAKWGDYNNDNHLDLLYDGIDSTNAGYTLIYENDGTNNFSELPVQLLPPSGEPGSVDWADIDGDQDLDVLISGTYLMRNDGNHLFTDISPFNNFEMGLPVSFTDYDNDGDQDIFLMTNGPLASTLYINNLVNAISETQQIKLSIYPNPAVEFISVELPFADPKAVYEITDEAGRIVLNGTLQNRTINIHGLAAAKYLLTIKKDNSRFTCSLFKE